MVMTDSSGSTVWQGEFKPFGEPLSVSGSITNNVRFPGQYYDSETDLHYNYFRDFKAEIGRYLESDPIGIDEGENHLYVYVKNSPVNWVDSLGLEASSCDCDKKKKCIGRARVLQGNPKLIGKPGGFGVAVTAGSAAVIPSQWGGKGRLRPNLGLISGTLSGGYSFCGITDVIGSDEVPNVREVLQNRYPGLLILELPSLPSDIGTVDVELSVPCNFPCPTGTTEKEL